MLVPILIAYLPHILNYTGSLFQRANGTERSAVIGREQSIDFHLDINLL